jgi:hypothetical protein
MSFFELGFLNALAVVFIGAIVVIALITLLLWYFREK